MGFVCINQRRRPIRDRATRAIAGVAGSLAACQCVAQPEVNDWIGGPFGAWESPASWSRAVVPELDQVARINNGGGVFATTRVQTEGLEIAAALDAFDAGNHAGTLRIETLLPPIPPVSVIGRSIVIGSAGALGAATGEFIVKDGLYLRAVTQTENRNLVIAEARGDDAYAWGSMSVDGDLTTEGSAYVASMQPQADSTLQDARIFGSLDVGGNFTSLGAVNIGTGRGGRTADADLIIAGDLIAESSALFVGNWRHFTENTDGFTGTAAATISGDVHGGLVLGTMDGDPSSRHRSASGTAMATIGGVLDGGVTVGRHDTESYRDSTFAEATIGRGIMNGSSITVGTGGSNIDARLTVLEGGVESLGSFSVGSATGLGDVRARVDILGDVIHRGGLSVGGSSSMVRARCDAMLTIHGAYTTMGQSATLAVGATSNKGIADATVEIDGGIDLFRRSTLRIARAFHESTVVGNLAVSDGDIRGIRTAEIAFAQSDSAHAEGTLTLTGDYLAPEDDATLTIAHATRPNASAMGRLIIDGSIGILDELTLAECSESDGPPLGATGHIEISNGSLDANTIYCGTSLQSAAPCVGSIRITDGQLNAAFHTVLTAGSIGLHRSTMETGNLTLRHEASIEILPDADALTLGAPVISIDGNATIDGTLDFRFEPAGPPAHPIETGDSITLLRIDGTRTGEFAHVPENAAVGQIGSLKWQLSYTGGDGNDIVVTAVPFRCSDADLAAPFGVVDLADIVAFVEAFFAGDPSADLGNDGVTDAADLVAFITAATSGCP